jgi:hypothetical protein
MEHRLTLRLPSAAWADLNALAEEHEAPLATMARHLLREQIKHQAMCGDFGCHA